MFIGYSEKILEKYRLNTRKTVKVSPKTMRLLQYGRGAINFARKKIPNAGNIRREISRSGGKSFLLASFMQQTLEAALSERSESPLVQMLSGHHSTKTSRRAYNAIKYGGGNCVEYAAIACKYLQYCVEKKENVGIVLCANTWVDHVFCAIVSHKDGKLRGNDIIVDPWLDCGPVLAKLYKLSNSKYTKTLFRKQIKEGNTTFKEKLDHMSNKYGHYTTLSDSEKQQLRLCAPVFNFVAKFCPASCMRKAKPGDFLRNSARI